MPTGGARAGAGRKRLAPREQGEPRAAVRLLPEQRQAIEQLARARAIPMSEITREALTLGLGLMAMEMASVAE